MFDFYNDEKFLKMDCDRVYQQWDTEDMKAETALHGSSGG